MKLYDYPVRNAVPVIVDGYINGRLVEVQMWAVMANE